MQNQFDNSVLSQSDTTAIISLSEFDQQYRKYTLECAFAKKRSQMKIEALQNNYSALISHYEEVIKEVIQQIANIQERVQNVERYEEDGLPLKSRMTNELTRQNRYMEELKSERDKAKALQLLFSLNADELVKDAIKNKSSALLIIKTPELIKKIPNNQIEHLSHQDSEMVKALASILASRTYTAEIPNIFAALKQQVTSEADKNDVVEKENEAIRKLLQKINSYLDKKIELALNSNKNPWALGYFGSNYKLNKTDKKIPVPQGIYELKGQIDQLGTIPPIEILANIQNTLGSKLKEIRDESIFQQIKRFVSYLCGYQRSDETIREYEYLDEVTSGKTLV